jgi:hypothetical protein
MSKLNEANDRLDAAMTLLEASVEARLEASVEARRDNVAASAGQGGQVQAELDKLKTDFAALRDTSGTVSSRLDAAIGRLRNILDE